MSITTNLMSNSPENRVISYHKMRLAVGVIGILLPFSLWIFNTIINETGILDNPNLIIFSHTYESAENLKSSISHFYYTSVGKLFTGALCAVSLFLFCYRGYARPSYGKFYFIPGDNFMCNFAGAMALLVVIFPTSSEKTITDNFRIFEASVVTGYVHYIAAVLFFIALTIISFVNFRRTKDPDKFGKMKSHPIYKYCALVMFSSMLVLLFIFVLGKMNVDVGWTNEYNLIFWLETVMLLAFGYAWIVKGKIDQQVFHVNYFGNGVEA